MFPTQLRANAKACLGYIVPEYYRWPGDLSPSLGLKQLGEKSRHNPGRHDGAKEVAEQQSNKLIFQKNMTMSNLQKRDL